MKASRLLAILAFAGICGASETQARSHRFEIKHLEKQRAERIEAHREAKERLNELNSRMSFKAAAEAAEIEEEAPGALENKTVPVDGNWAVAEQEIRNFNWKVTEPDLIRERELEESGMRSTAREIAEIDKAIRKEKARERLI